MLAEKSQSSEHEKYKIIKGGLRGKTKMKIFSETSTINFEKLKLNHASYSDRSCRLLISLYKATSEGRTYENAYVSDEFFIIENYKILVIDNHEILRLYFEKFQEGFLDKSYTQTTKIPKDNKAKVIE